MQKTFLPEISCFHFIYFAIIWTSTTGMPKRSISFSDRDEVRAITPIPFHLHDLVYYSRDEISRFRRLEASTTEKTQSAVHVSSPKKVRRRLLEDKAPRKPTRRCSHDRTDLVTACYQATLRSITPPRKLVDIQLDRL